MGNENNILIDLKATLESAGITVFEAGVWTDENLPDTYLVIYPIGDDYEAADDTYIAASEKARVLIYRRGALSTSIYAFKDSIVAALMGGGFALSNSLYDGYNVDTGYHCWRIDAAAAYTINITSEE